MWSVHVEGVRAQHWNFAHNLKRRPEKSVKVQCCVRAPSAAQTSWIACTHPPLNYRTNSRACSYTHIASLVHGSSTRAGQLNGNSLFTCLQGIISKSNKSGDMSAWFRVWMVEALSFFLSLSSIRGVIGISLQTNYCVKRILECVSYVVSILNRNYRNRKALEFYVSIKRK